MSSDPAAYVEGVPVKISEKYRPPRKVTLSSLCNYQINTEVLTSEYDESLENDVLKLIEDLKTHKAEKLKLREERIRLYEEEKAKALEEEKARAIEEEKQRLEELRLEHEKIAKENERQKQEEEEKKKLESEEEKLEEEVSLEKSLDNDEVEVNEDCEKTEEEKSVVENDQEINVDRESYINTPNNSVSQSSIYSGNTDTQVLVPQHPNTVTNYVNNQVAFPSSADSQQPSYPPMLVPTQCMPQVGFNQKSPIKSRCNINFAEFEADASDPFDSVALKSINDMEELAKVLQTTNLKQQKGYAATNNSGYNYQQPGTYLNGGYSYNPYPYMNYQQSNLPIDSSLYSQISSYQSKVPSTSTTSVPLDVKSNFSHNYSQWNQMPQNINTMPIESASTFKPYNYALPHTVLPKNGNATIDNNISTMGSAFPNSGLPPGQRVGSTLTNSTIPAPNAGLESVGKRQDLEDFYTRYYSNKRSPSSGVHSEDSTPTNNQQNSKTLSASSSVPDLTAIEDSEVSNIVLSNPIERSQHTKGSTNHLIPQRPSSTGGYETSPKSPRCARTQNRLPDPFTELTDDAQTLVQGMAEMGFPRPRVARAVQLLGTDHKKLLEVLLTLQSFQENGEDEYRAEKAFYFFMGEVIKVKEFLSASKALLRLGFEEEKVINGLFKHQNDQEKCLAELIE